MYNPKSSLYKTNAAIKAATPITPAASSLPAPPVGEGMAPELVALPVAAVDAFEAVEDAEPVADVDVLETDEDTELFTEVEALEVDEETELATELEIELDNDAAGTAMDEVEFPGCDAAIMQISVVMFEVAGNKMLELLEEKIRGAYPRHQRWSKL
jgi:hypothetical protein